MLKAGGLEGAEFAWGDEFTPGGQHMANTWQGNFPNKNLRADRWARTSPVRAFPPNGYGVHDMISNVREWTTDWYSTKHEADAAKTCCVPANPRGAGPAKSLDEEAASTNVAAKAGLLRVRRARRDVEDISLIQVYRLGSPLPRHLEQRLEMLGGSTAPHRDIGLDCRSAQMAVEDCLRRLELDALVIAVQQLAQALYSTRGQLAQRSLDHIWDAGPAARIGAATWQPVSALVAFHDRASSIFFGAVGPRRRHEYLTSSQARRELACGGAGLRVRCRRAAGCGRPACCRLTCVAIRQQHRPASSSREAGAAMAATKLAVSPRP